MNKYLQINENDNVVVCLGAIESGDEIALLDGTVITALDSIPAGHKMAVKSIEKGHEVIKYGYPIGRVTEDVKPGNWVHTHNTETKLKGVLQYEYKPDLEAVPTFL